MFEKYSCTVHEYSKKTIWRMSHMSKYREQIHIHFGVAEEIKLFKIKIQFLKFQF